MPVFPLRICNTIIEFKNTCLHYQNKISQCNVLRIRAWMFKTHSVQTDKQMEAVSHVLDFADQWWESGLDITTTLT
jgi:hypothetical protein